MNSDHEFPLKELHTRLLYPFLLQEADLAPAVATLEKLTYETRKGAAPVWETVAVPHEFYRQELLDTVETFLFPADEASRTRRSCRYLRVVGDRLNAWFRNWITVREPGGEALANAKLMDSGIELFLSPYGVGLLSIGLMVKLSEGEDFGLDFCKRFNYRLVQLRRQGTVPTLAIPHPRDQQEKDTKVGDKVPPPPAADAPFIERLGKAGGAFTLPELLEFLLSPLQERGLQQIQQQFSLYTVVRFDATADFASPSVRQRLGPALAGLAQIEEETHAGASPEQALDIVNHVLNTRHWAGVGFLGAAHLVADQEPYHPFNEQRVPTVRDKYFIPYVLAFLQRLTCHRTLRLATAAVHAADAMDTGSGNKDENLSFHRLNATLLDFTVTGYFTEVSSREVLNRFYRMAQQGLGVERTRERVTQAIQDHHANRLTDDVSRNVETVSHVQRKVEWLEVFFVSFYATELTHLISEAFFSPDFGHYSLLFWPLFAGGLALWGLQPWQTTHRPHKGRWKIILAVLVVAIGIWFALGWVIAGKH